MIYPDETIENADWPKRTDDRQHTRKKKPADPPKDAPAAEDAKPAPTINPDGTLPT